MAFLSYILPMRNPHEHGEKMQSIDRATSYVVGTGGVVSGITWADFVHFSSDLTTIVGCITALLGCVVVALRLYYDIKKGKSA